MLSIHGSKLLITGTSRISVITKIRLYIWSCKINLFIVRNGRSSLVWIELSEFISKCTFYEVESKQPFYQLIKPLSLLSLSNQLVILKPLVYIKVLSTILYKSQSVGNFNTFHDFSNFNVLALFHHGEQEKTREVDINTKLNY